MATAEIGALRVRLGLDAGEFSKGLGKAGGQMDRLAVSAKKLGATIAAALATQAIVNFGKAAVRSFGKQEDAIAAVEAVVKATGGSAGFTTAELAKMASGLQEVSTFGDEDILKGAIANMLTFTNIVADNFPGAIQAVLDLSARLGQDLQSSTIQVGKALNDPIKGITALSRVGVAFTTTQKDMIKTLVQTGDIMGAQKIILAELGKEFGGQATALATTMQGQLTQAANAFGDAMESIGQRIAPVAVTAANAIKSISEAFSNLSPEAQRFIVYATASTAVIGTLAVAAGLLVGVFGTMLLPIAGVAAGIALASGAVAAFWPNIQKLAGIAMDAFSAVYSAAKNWLIDGLAPIFEAIQHRIAQLGAGLQWLGEKVGLVAAAEAIAEATAPAVDKVAAMGQALRDAWTVEADKNEKSAPALAKGLAAANVQAGALSEAGAAKQKEATKAALDAQNKLIEDGVKLSEKVRTPFEVMTEEVKALDAALAAGKINAAQYGEAMDRSSWVAQGAYASMASNIAGSLEQVFGKSKAVAIAAALINSYEAATKALAAYPPPFNYIAAAATMAAGLAQVANIRKTTKSSGGGGGGGGASAAAPQTPQVGVQQSLMVQGIGANQLFSGGTVKMLAQKLVDFQKDGGKVVIQ